MKTRYLRLSRHHALIAGAAGIVVLLSVLYAIVQGLGDHPGPAIFSACCAATFLFIAILETCESLRCLKIAERWDMWDRRDLPPTH